MSETMPQQRGFKRIGRSLSNRNFRRYLGGMWLSMLGMWMENTAAAWLVFDLTGSPMALGLYATVRLGPILVLGAYGGLLADRFQRHRLMMITQSMLFVGALALMVVTFMPSVSIVIVFAIGLFQGCVNAVENPLKRSYIRDLVSDEDLPNAVALNSTVATVARMAGPAAGGITIALLGISWNFGLNALSYAAVLVALMCIDRSRLRTPALTPRGSRQVRAGLRYAMADDRIWTILVVAMFVGTFAWNYGVLMPVYSRVTFEGDAVMFGAMLATVGAGSFTGALRSARRGALSQIGLLQAVAWIGAALVAAAAAPSLPLALVALFALGLFGTTAIIAAQTNLQLHVADDMSGRVLALYSMAFIGTKPFGGLVAGWLMEISGPRLAFLICGLAVVAAAIGLGAYEHWRTSKPHNASAQRLRTDARELAAAATSRHSNSDDRSS